MARWRLTQPHYLNVPGTEWEYKETDRTSGRQGRKIFDVPLLLDPNDSTCYNYPGECVVSDGNHPGPKDYIFLGPPTPDMDPMDDEAEKISASLADKWKHPIESLPGQGYSQSLLADFQTQLAAAMAQTPIQKVAGPVSAGSVDPAAFAALQEQVAQLMARNAELEAEKPAKPEPVARRA